MGRRKSVTTGRKFDGKRFKYHNTYSKKGIAKDHAKELRKQKRRGAAGYMHYDVRITKGVSGWNVWKRRSRKLRR